MNLLIAGDLFISDEFRDKSILHSSVRDLFAEADYRIVNLEAPITTGAKKRRILKTGPHLHVTPKTVLPVLKDLRVNLVTLANNHMMDFGRPGLEDTLKSLGDEGIGAVGAGLDLAAAAKPVFFERDGSRIAVLNFGENEWAGAETHRAGANPMDVIENARQIREARAISETVVVVIHGGMEDYHFPTPRMVKQYRFYAENGASVIVGHHTHCMSGYEIHAGTPIFYSLGNFLFTKPHGFEGWYKGLVLNLGIRRGQSVSWELLPIAQSPKDFTLACLTGDERLRVIREVDEYARIIADEAALDQKWRSFVAANDRRYLNIFNPLNALGSWPIRAVLFRLRADRFFKRKAQYAEILNTIRCETHAEAAKDVIEEILR